MGYYVWKGAAADTMRSRMLRYLTDEPSGNILITMHTYADVKTGHLCNSQSQDGTTALHNSVEEVLHYNIG